jgi:Protein of unknown function (DUF3533)
VRPLVARPVYAMVIMFANVCVALVNVSVSVFPPALLPGFYRYGYGMPFYHVQQSVRTVIFGTRNQSAST